MYPGCQLTTKSIMLEGILLRDDVAEAWVMFERVEAHASDVAGMGVQDTMHGIGVIGDQVVWTNAGKGAYAISLIVHRSSNLKS